MTAYMSFVTRLLNSTATPNNSLQPTPLRGAAELTRWAVVPRKHTRLTFIAAINGATDE